jgi:hypothetical protein
MSPLHRLSPRPAYGGVVVVLVVVLVSPGRVVVVLLVLRGHLPLKSQGWFFRWRRRLRLLTKSVRALSVSHKAVTLSKGTWQMGTKHSSSSWSSSSSRSSSASAREGISEAMAVPAKSFSARRRLSEPSATACASSSKERLVVSLLTCAPFLQRAGHYGISPAQVINEGKYEGLQGLAQLPRIGESGSSTSENSVNAKFNFGEFPF